MENWAEIPDFPKYAISDRGNVLNLENQRLMATSYNNYGDRKISLLNWRGERITRPVALMIAEAFVERPDQNSLSVIILDGDKTNLDYRNLAWRPRHFTWRYTRQMHNPFKLHYLNLRVTDGKHMYPNAVAAAVENGLLLDDIWRSTYSKTKCYPTGQTFEIAE